jgi:hypothetical protein
MKKCLKMPVCFTKMVLAQHNCLASKKPQPRMCSCRKECNKYDLTTDLSVSDWPITMIGPGGLLFAYLLSQFQFYGWGCGKVNN